MKLIRKNKKGFTLVELIVVIAILAILALILIPAITGYIAKAEDSRVDSSASALYTQAILLQSENESLADIKTKLEAELANSGKSTDTVVVAEDATDGSIIVTVTNGKDAKVTYPKGKEAPENP